MSAAHNAHERYLSALAEAEAAKAEYMRSLTFQTQPQFPPVYPYRAPVPPQYYAAPNNRSALAEAEATKAEYMRSLAFQTQPQFPPVYPHPAPVSPQYHAAPNDRFNYPGSRNEEQELFEAFTAFRKREQAKKAEAEAKEELRRVRQVEHERAKRQALFLAQQQQEKAEREAFMAFIAQNATHQPSHVAARRHRVRQERVQEHDGLQSFLNQYSGARQQERRLPSEAEQLKAFFSQLTHKKEQPAKQTSEADQLQSLLGQVLGFSQEPINEAQQPAELEQVKAFLSQFTHKQERPARQNEADQLQSILGRVLGLSEKPVKEEQQARQTESDQLQSILSPLFGFAREPAKEAEQPAEAKQPTETEQLNAFFSQLIFKQEQPVKQQNDSETMRPTNPQKNHVPAAAGPCCKVHFFQDLAQKQENENRQSTSAQTQPTAVHTPAPQSKSKPEGVSMVEQLMAAMGDVSAAMEYQSNPVAPSAQASLAEQYGDADAELQRAILESLKTTEISTTETKGKGRESPLPVISGEINASQSFNAITAIENKFTALSSEFVFPPKLDFNLSGRSSRPASPVASALDRLLYTGANAPVRYYDKAMNALLTELDSIDSMGSDILRIRRKDVVGKVEEALEALEAEVEGRWHTAERKASKTSEPDVAEPSLSENEAPATIVVTESLVAPYEVEFPEPQEVEVVTATGPRPISDDLQVPAVQPSPVADLDDTSSAPILVDGLQVPDEQLEQPGASLAETSSVPARSHSPSLTDPASDWSNVDA